MIIIRKCKDCFHYEICPTWDYIADAPYKEGNRGRCHNYDKFKEKSKFIELPCNIINFTEQLLESKTATAISAFWEQMRRMLLTQYVEEKSKAEAKLKELNNESKI